MMAILRLVILTKESYGLPVTMILESQSIQASERAN